MAVTTPYLPENPSLPRVGEHTLVSSVDTEMTWGMTELDHLMASLWRLIHDFGRTRTRPLSVLEIASRSGLSRGVAVLAVSELLRHHRVRVSHPHTSRSLPSAYYDPDLSSAKVVVLGSPEVLARQFVGACSHTRPLAVQETVTGPHRALFTMGMLPLGNLYLCLLALPEPREWEWGAAVWQSAFRDACGAILVAHPDDLGAAGRALAVLRRRGALFHVVLHHPDDTAPDPDAVAEVLGVSAETVTLADVRSMPAARTALRDFLMQNRRMFTSVEGPR